MNKRLKILIVIMIIVIVVPSFITVILRGLEAKNNTNNDAVVSNVENVNSEESEEDDNKEDSKKDYSSKKIDLMYYYKDILRDRFGYDTSNLTSNLWDYAITEVDPTMGGTEAYIVGSMYSTPYIELRIEYMNGDDDSVKFKEVTGQPYEEIDSDFNRREAEILQERWN